MSTFQGYRLTDIVTGVSPDRAPFFESSESEIYPSAITPEIDYIAPGSKTIGTNPFINKTVSGHFVGSYAENFYKKILIEPVFIDFGSVLSTQERDITVFNGYLTDRIIEDIVLNDFDTKITFVGDTTPSTYRPLEERTHTITIIPGGPPSVDASIDYDWEGTSDDITVSFIGSRIVFLPITSRDGMKEKLLWLNNVMVSRNGTEQRVRNRDAPRQQFSLKAYLNNNDKTFIENIIYGRRGGQFALPMWHESRVGSDITFGDTIINVDTQYGDFRVGYLAIAWKSSRKFFIFQIEAKTDTSLTPVISAPDNFTNPIIMPIRTGRFLNDPTRNATGYDGVFSGSFEVTDNIKLDTSPSPTQFNDEDFYDERPLMTSTDGVSDKYNTKVDLIDYKTGALAQISPWLHTRVNRQFNLIFEGLEDIWNFRLWLHRRAGRLVPFYMPTFENNLKILNRGILSDQLRCQNDLYTGQASDRSHLAFRKTDNTWEFRTVLSSAINVSNEDVITLDSSLNFDYEEIDFVSYMGLKRLLSDTFEFTWLSNNVATVSVSITEITP